MVVGYPSVSTWLAAEAGWHCCLDLMAGWQTEHQAESPTITHNQFPRNKCPQGVNLTAAPDTPVMPQSLGPSPLRDKSLDPVI